jgi:hypothetical protein
VQTNDGGYLIAGVFQRLEGGLSDADSSQIYVIKTDSLGHSGLDYGVSTKCVNKPKSSTLSAHPNPFNSAVTIAVDGVGDGSPVPFDVEIYDVNGRMVEGGTVGAYCIRPIDGSTRLTPTTQEYIWTPDKSLPSGVYLVRATFGDCEMARRVVYLK